MTHGPLKGAKMIVPTKLPPEGWAAPTRASDPFFCFPLGCKGVRAETCVVRQNKINRASKEPFFALCHAKCRQGQMVREAIGSDVVAPVVEGRNKAREKVVREHHHRKRTDAALRDEIVDRMSVLGLTVERVADIAGVPAPRVHRLVGGEPVSGWVWKRMEMATGLLTAEEEGM
jgi:hypothetical protein